MTRLCQWLVAVAPLFVFVSAGPVEIQKRRGVSLPLKHGVSRSTRGLNVRRGNLKRSRSSIIADLNFNRDGYFRMQVSAWRCRPSQDF